MSVGQKNLSPQQDSNLLEVRGVTIHIPYGSIWLCKCFLILIT